MDFQQAIAYNVQSWILLHSRSKHLPSDASHCLIMYIRAEQGEEHLLAQEKDERNNQSENVALHTLATNPLLLGIIQRLLRPQILSMLSFLRSMLERSSMSKSIHMNIPLFGSHGLVANITGDGLQ